MSRTFDQYTVLYADTLSRRGRAETTIFVPRTINGEDRDVDVTVSARFTVEYRDIGLQDFESSMPLSALEIDEAMCALADVVRCN